MSALSWITLICSLVSIVFSTLAIRSSAETARIVFELRREHAFERTFPRAVEMMRRTAQWPGGTYPPTPSEPHHDA